MLKEIVILVLMTLTPFLELRASIPYGFLVLSMNIFLVFFICAITNILLAPLVWLFIYHFLQLFLKIKFINKIYNKMIIKNRTKIEPYVKKYGKIGLALFIAIPLPGSGVISGGLGAYLLGFDFKDYMKASIIGVLIAAILVSLITLFGNGLWHIFIKV